MNTSRDNLECQIRKQIEEREIEPSRDLWSEIELQTGINNRLHGQINWFFVAACLVVMLGLGGVLFFSKETPESAPKIVKEVNKPDTHKPAIKSDSKDYPLVTQGNPSQTVKNSSSQEMKKTIVSPVFTDDKKIVLKEPILEKKPAVIQHSDPKIIAQVDTLKTPMKKKKYVDPETLLFSVEHKDIIEKTKGKSNVATIDLNSK